MTSAIWTPTADAQPAIWDKNKALADLERTAPLYDDATITYDAAIFYNGYDPATYTPEGEAGAVWAEVAE